jgi:hypothetical protein
MTHPRTLLLTALLAVTPPLTAHASPFTDFADDENVCRQAGAHAIAGAIGPQAAQRYDYAYNTCMAAHIHARQRGAYLAGPPIPPERLGNPHTAEFPDAYYSVPYATPGYGYDGFSPY